MSLSIFGVAASTPRNDPYPLLGAGLLSSRERRNLPGIVDSHEVGRKPGVEEMNLGRLHKAFFQVGVP
jgi:hypothetical protein